MSTFYSENDKRRLSKEIASKHNFTSEFSRDYARLIHSPGCRRLNGKTQLFPNAENDFFRNRLTHSLEVAQIAKSIAQNLNQVYNLEIDVDLMAFAAMAHDIGHPPFGHQGEEALHECMKGHGGFEGNAQTLRLLTRLEKKHQEISHDTINGHGLNLTVRSIAAIVKYDVQIPKNISDPKPMKGYYSSEKDIITALKKNLNYNKSFGPFKTLECSIMDIADDIAYCNFDLEDSMKAGFLTILDLLVQEKKTYKRIAEKLNSRVVNLPKQKKVLIYTEDAIQKILIDRFGEHLIHKIDISSKNDANEFIPFINEMILYQMNHAYNTSLTISNNGKFRTRFISENVKRHIAGVEFELNKENIAFSKVYLKKPVWEEVEILKQLVFISQIESPKLRVAEFRGKEIVKRIFSILDNEKIEGYKLMPIDFQELYNNAHNENTKKRVICDFIAGMTDAYAMDFYSRLTSADTKSIFKPM